MNKASRTTCTGTLLVAAAAAAVACSETPTVRDTSPHRLATIETDDSVEWGLDNVLEFEHEGSTYRFERDQQEATIVTAFVDDSLVATIYLRWQSQAVDTLRIEDDDRWVDVNPNAQGPQDAVYDTDSGWEEDPCECPPEPEPCEPCVQRLDDFDCDDEKQILREEANETIEGGLVTGLVALFDKKLARIPLVWTMFNLGNTIGARICLYWCENGVSSPCSDPDGFSVTLAAADGRCTQGRRAGMVDPRWGRGRDLYADFLRSGSRVQDARSATAHAGLGSARSAD